MLFLFCFRGHEKDGAKEQPEPKRKEKEKEEKRKRERERTTTEERPLAPIHRQQNPRPHTHALREIHAPPQIHRQKAATEAQAVVIKDRRIANIRQTAQVVIIERLVHRLIEIAIIHLVRLQAGRGGGHFVEFLAEVLALLVGALGGSGEGGELVVDLDEELVEFAEVERAALVLVVFLEEPVQTPEVVRGLREALLHFLRHAPPFGEGDFHAFRVTALFVGEAAQEVDEVVCDVVLDRGAVADGVDGAEGRAVEAKVGVRFKRVFVGLRGAEAVGERFAEVRLR